MTDVEKKVDMSLDELVAMRQKEAKKKAKKPAKKTVRGAAKTASKKGKPTRKAVAAAASKMNRQQKMNARRGIGGPKLSQNEIQKRAGDGFSLSYDVFGRTSSQPNITLTQHFAEVLEARGLIEERIEHQVFSIDDDRFLPDRYVEGTCPHCGFERARGDQCDNCGRLLEPTDLKEPYSKISGSKNLEVRETKHLHLLQTKMETRIRDWVDASTEWPGLAKSIAYKWLDEGLRDRSITRDLKWGVPVTKNGQPREGFEDKVFYVWFDAPIEYIACGAEWAEANGLDASAWERWWRTDKGAEDVRYTQFMGKDNVPFHTLSFPATILGSGEPWKLVDYIKSFNYLNYDGGQFSTSRGRGVFMDQALEILPADYWRWWLLSNAPESSDAEFTWENFQANVNKDLADVLGNFVSRITKFCRSKFGEVVPEGGSYGEQEEKLIADITTRLRDYEAHMNAIDVRKAAAELRAIWVAGNECEHLSRHSTCIFSQHIACASIRSLQPTLPVHRCSTSASISSLRGCTRVDGFGFERRVCEAQLVKITGQTKNMKKTVLVQNEALEWGATCFPRTKEEGGRGEGG